MNPVEHLLQFFGHADLPPRMQPVGALYHDLAFELATTLPAGPELTVALRKLLDSREAALRHAAVTPPAAPAYAPVDSLLAGGRQPQSRI